MCCTDMDTTNKGNCCVNQLGGVFLNGRPLPVHKRRMMIELASEGVRPCQISQILKVSSGCISKILSRYKKTGMLCPKATGGSRPWRLTPEIVATIIQHKNARPNIFAWEIRQILLAGRISEAEKIPSVSSINRILKKMKMDTFASNGIYEECVDAGPGQGSGLCGPGQGQEQEQLLKPWSLPPSRGQQRTRTHFTAQQAETLEQEFLQNHYPDMLAREKIATQICVPEDTIKVWFSNRRAKLRRESQTKQNDCTSQVTASISQNEKVCNIQECLSGYKSLSQSYMAVLFILPKGPVSLCSVKTPLSLTHPQDGRFTFAHRNKEYFQMNPSEIPPFSLNQNYPENSVLCWAHCQPLQPPYSVGYPQSEQTVNLTYFSDSSYFQQ